MARHTAASGPVATVSGLVRRGSAFAAEAQASLVLVDGAEGEAGGVRLVVHEEVALQALAD
eukprot:4791085-Prymnesium_polylepis.1